MAQSPPSAGPGHLRRPRQPDRRRRHLRDLPDQCPRRPLRRRPAPLLDQGGPGEPAPPRGRGGRPTRRHRGGSRVGRPSRAAWAGRRERRRNRPDPRTGADAGLHRRARGGRPGRHAGRPGRRWAATRPRSTRWSRWSWSSTTRSSPRCPAAPSLRPRTSTSSTSATSSATSSCAGPSRPSTASGWYRRAPASATRSTSSTCRGSSSPPTTGGPTATPWSAPTPTPPWSTGSACWAGGWAASRPRRPCSASPSPCCCRRWSGFRLTGEQAPGTTATDLVLTITHLLRQHGVVGKFVEFFGPGVAAVPLANRATIGNMSPEYGATCAIFPIDDVTLDYLRFTGRDDHHVDLVEAYAKEQGMFHLAGGVEPVFSETIELDLSTVVPSIAGPARPQDLVTLAGAGAAYRPALGRDQRSAPATLADGSTADGRGRRRGGGRHHQLHQHLQPPGDGGRRSGGPAGRGARPGAQAVGQDLAGARARGWSWTTSTGPGSPSRWPGSASTWSDSAAPPASGTPDRCCPACPKRSMRATCRWRRCCRGTGTSKVGSTPRSG